jgi:hypothetical protein
MVPILDQLLHWKRTDIVELFESFGLSLSEWEKDRTDRIKVGEMRALATDAEVLAI